LQAPLCCLRSRCSFASACCCQFPCCAVATLTGNAFIIG
jgi:hypothetical protein